MTLVGGLPYDEATFDYLFPDFSEHNQSVLSEVRFHVVENGVHYQLDPKPDVLSVGHGVAANPSGVYALYAELVDSRGNVYSSEPMYRILKLSKCNARWRFYFSLSGKR